MFTSRSLVAGQSSQQFPAQSARPVLQSAEAIAELNPWSEWSLPVQVSQIGASVHGVSGWPRSSWRAAEHGEHRAVGRDT